MHNKNYFLRGNQFSFSHLSSFRIFMGFLLTIVFSFVTPLPALTITQNAVDATSEAEVQFFTPSLFPTPTSTNQSTLPLDPLELLHQTPTPAATKSTEEPAADYCVEVPVLMYHHIQPLQVASLLGHAPLTVDSTIFENQMIYLNDHGYTALSADDLVNALKHKQQLPEKPVMITIDDGYDDNYTYAYMTAKKQHMIMNFMIPTQLIGKPGYMNWDHLREMHVNEYARIYNHTATHAPLGYILKNQIHQELATSKDDFKRELNYMTDIFTYPYGSYTPIAIDVLKEDDFNAAFTTEDGQTHCLSNIMQLPRKRIGNAPMSSYGY